MFHVFDANLTSLVCAQMVFSFLLWSSSVSRQFPGDIVLIQLAVKMCRLSRGSSAARYPALTSRSGHNSVFSGSLRAAALESLRFLLLFRD